LREGGVGNPITADDAVHSDVVVEEVARHGAGDFVNILESGPSSDVDHLGTGKTLPVETLLSHQTGEVLAELAEKLDRIRGDENAFVQKNNRGRQNVLVGIVAVREPT